MRIAPLLVLLALAGCAALSPRPQSPEQRLAALPAAGAEVQRPVTIRWNDHLVPWIEAETDRDAAYALGLVHGHLRGGQIALLRMVSQGRLSEIAGPLATDVDHSLRILGFGRAAAEIERRFPPETRAFVEAFVAGLNHATLNARRPPPEFALLGLRPEPYSVQDILTIGRLAGTDVNWLGYISLLPQRGQPGFAELWQRTRDAGANAAEPARTPDARPQVLHDILAGMNRAGSNTVAVSGARSASGAAMIASDPHLGVNLPNLWLIVGVRSPSLHAVGLMVPGLPILGLGRNEKLAWGGTNLRAASSDLFVVDPAQSRRETVRIRQRLWFTAEREVRVSPLGPVITDSPFVRNGGGEALALRWVGHEPTDEITALLAAARSHTPEQFRESFAGFGVSAQTMLWAHRDGRIGRLTAATLPDRTGFPARDVVLPASEAGAWSRLRDHRALPAVVSPREGVLASANDRPAPGSPPIGFFFSDDDRVQRLTALLAARPRHSAEDLMAIQRDTLSPKAQRLAAALAQRLARVGGVDAAFLRDLAAFDGDYRADSRGPVMLETLLRHLVPALVPPERRDATGNPRTAEQGWNFITTFLIADLDALPPERRDAVLRDAATAAARDAARFASWGEMHRLRAAHWLVNLPVLGPRFILGDFPAGGSRETPMKTSHGLVADRHSATFGSMARHVSDMADPDANWFTLWGGQDGWLGSAAFADQVPLWREGRMIRVPLRAATVAREFPRVTTLAPR